MVERRERERERWPCPVFHVEECGCRMPWACIDFLMPQEHAMRGEEEDRQLSSPTACNNAIIGIEPVVTEGLKEPPLAA